MTRVSRTFATVVCLTLGACTQAPRSDGPVTTIAELATRSNGRRDVRVQLRGVVTYSERKWGYLFVQDETGAIAAYHNPQDVEYHPGTAVELTGSATVGPNLSQPFDVAEPHIRIVGSQGMPEPRRIALDELPAACDGRWIETGGTVDSAEIWEGYLRLALASAGERLEVRIRDYPMFEFKELIGVSVGVRGVCIPAPAEEARLADRRLLTSRFADLVRRGMASGRESGLQIPLTQGDALPAITHVVAIRRLTMEEAGRHQPVKIYGVVTYFDPAWSMLFVQDRT